MVGPFSSSLRRRRLLTVTALVFALAAFPLGTVAIHQFSDVPDSNVFHNDIDAIADAGVTTGCGGGLYCPSAYVTREQMAAFMNRLGALAADKTPVVNATTVDRLSADQLTRFAWNAISDDALVGTSGTVISVDITAPVRGWLHIVASSDTLGTGIDLFSCRLTVDGNPIAASERYMSVDPANANSEENCSTNGAWITCGGTHTVALEGGLVDPETKFDEATIEVTFHPFNGLGTRLNPFLCLV